jgi:hypothetical protein
VHRRTPSPRITAKTSPPTLRLNGPEAEKPASFAKGSLLLFFKVKEASFSSSFSGCELLSFFRQLLSFFPD